MNGAKAERLAEYVGEVRREAEKRDWEWDCDRAKGDTSREWYMGSMLLAAGRAEKAGAAGDGEREIGSGDLLDGWGRGRMLLGMSRGDGR